MGQGEPLAPALPCRVCRTFVEATDLAVLGTKSWLFNYAAQTGSLQVGGEGSFPGLPGRRPDFRSLKWPLGEERNQQAIKHEGQKHSPGEDNHSAQGGCRAWGALRTAGCAQGLQLAAQRLDSHAGLGWGRQVEGNPDRALQPGWFSGLESGLSC